MFHFLLGKDLSSIRYQNVRGMPTHTEVQEEVIQLDTSDCNAIKLNGKWSNAPITLQIPMFLFMQDRCVAGFPLMAKGSADQLCCLVVQAKSTVSFRLVVSDDAEEIRRYHEIVQSATSSGRTPTMAFDEVPPGIKEGVFISPLFSPNAAHYVRLQFKGGMDLLKGSIIVLSENAGGVLELSIAAMNGRCPLAGSTLNRDADNARLLPDAAEPTGETAKRQPPSRRRGRYGK